MGYFKILATPVSGPKPFSVTDFLRSTLQSRPDLCLAYCFLVVTDHILEPDNLQLITKIQDQHEAEIGKSKTYIPQRYLDQFDVEEQHLERNIESALQNFGSAMIIYPVPGKDYDHALAVLENPDNATLHVTSTSPKTEKGLPIRLKFSNVQSFISSLTEKGINDFQTLCYPEKSAPSA